MTAAGDPWPRRRTIWSRPALVLFRVRRGRTGAKAAAGHMALDAIEDLRFDVHLVGNRAN